MNINEIIEHWKHISPIIREPQNAEDYNQLASVLDQLLDIVRDDESHELMGLIDIIGNMIATYDETHDDHR
jgi:HTH-type transcriptional regulator/antitoxin HigA